MWSHIQREESPEEKKMRSWRKGASEEGALRWQLKRKRPWVTLRKDLELRHIYASTTHSVSTTHSKHRTSSKLRTKPTERSTLGELDTEHFHKTTWAIVFDSIWFWFCFSLNINSTFTCSIPLIFYCSWRQK